MAKVKVNRIISFLVLLVIYATNLHCQEELNYVKDQIIVKFKNDILNYEFLESDKVSMNSIDIINQEYVTKGDSLNLFLNKTTTVSKVFTTLKPSTKSIVAKSGKIIDNSNLYNTVVFTLDSEVNIIDLCNNLNNISFIEYAEPNYIFKFYSTKETFPNDVDYDDRGSLEQIGLNQIWREIKYMGDSNVRVGIVDSGIDYTHIDLGDGAYKTENAKVVEGYNFMTNALGYPVSDSWDCMDTYGHGTNVAGVVAAYTNNVYNIAGVAGNCSLVGLKVTEEWDGQWYEVIATASSIARAIEAGSRAPFSCDILNFSFGTEYFEYSIQNMLKEVVMNTVRRGVLIVGAKGNEGVEMTSYPTEFTEYSLSVSANSRDGLADYSNYGGKIDILAPRQCVTTSLGNTTDTVVGTSFSSPLVAGVAALLLSYNNDLYAEDLHKIITRSAQKLLDMGDADYTKYHGYGMLDAKAAFDYVYYGNIEHHIEGADEGNGSWKEDYDSELSSCVINVPFNTTRHSNNSPGIYLHTWLKRRKIVNLPTDYSRVEIWGNNSGNGSVDISEPSYGDCFVVSVDQENNTAVLESRNYGIYSIADGFLGLTTGGETMFGYTTVGFYDNVLLQLSETEITTNAASNNIVVLAKNIGDQYEAPFEYQIESDCPWVHINKTESNTKSYFTINIDKNYTDAPRTCSVKIKSKWAIESNEIIINQDRAPSDLYIENFELDFTSQEQASNFTICKADISDMLDVDYSIDVNTLPSWLQITSQISNNLVPPGITDFYVSKNYLDFTDRIGVINLNSPPSEFVQNPTDPNASPYNSVTITQSACPQSETDHLKPQLAVFDDTMKLVHYDPTDQVRYPIKTNVITNLDWFNMPTFFSTTACDYDNDGIDEQVVLHDDFNYGFMVLFYKLGEPEYSKQITLGWDTDYDEIESIDINNDGIEEVVVAGHDKLAIYSVVSGDKLYSYDLTSETFTGDKISITAGDYNFDNNPDIAITDGLKLVTLSVNDKKIEKIILDVDLSDVGDYYYFRDLTTFNDGNERILLVYQGMTETKEYTTKIMECNYDINSKIFNVDDSFEILALNSKDIRKVVAGDFIEDENNEDEFAFLHYGYDYVTQSHDIESYTTCISIFRLDREDPPIQPPFYNFELEHRINASEYISNYFGLTSGQFYDKLRPVLKAGSELVIEPGDNSIFPPNATVEARTGSKITVRDGAVLDLTNVTINGTDTWQGITTEIGSSIVLSNTTINNAVTVLNATASDVNITNSTFSSCDNGIILEACDNIKVEDCTFNGNGTGSAISVIQSGGLGNIHKNTIENFSNGIIVVSCSPNITMNTISNNVFSGIYTTGLNSYPKLIYVPRENEMLSYRYKNNEIYDNGYVPYLPDPHFITEIPGQICVFQRSGIYMQNGHNNVSSNSTSAVPCIVYGASFLPADQDQLAMYHINVERNFWGSSNVTDDFFRTGHSFTIDYDPVASSSWGGLPATSPSPEEESKPYKLLIKAMTAEFDGKFDKAIKVYLKIIDKYPDSEEALVTYSQLPDNYIGEGLDLEPLQAMYDDKLASTDESVNKKFFKEMKVVTHLKGKKYDEAIVISEEMILEADSDDEVILCQIDIAIANMMKNAGGKGKSGTSSTINDLLAKLNGNEDKEEPTDIEEVALPTEFTLYQNYPNPFNPITEIKYTLPTVSDVKLNVYNIKGQLVSELINGNKQAGIHTVNFDGNNLNSGMYFYTLEANGRVVNTKKMLLIK